MLEDLAIENKNLQKINREQEKEIDAYYKDKGFEHKVIEFLYFIKIDRLTLELKKLNHCVKK